MAKRTSLKSRPMAKSRSKKAARKRPVARRVARKASTNGTGTKRKIQKGVITHTELASADPAATQQWCEKVLGWKFGPAMPTPTGPYRMWRFANGTGGGIRSHNPPEVPGSIPYCEVTDIRAAYAKALDLGATALFAPEEIPGGMGWIAIVAAPGGVAIGFWGEK